MERERESVCIAVWMERCDGGGVLKMRDLAP